MKLPDSARPLRLSFVATLLALAACGGGGGGGDDAPPLATIGYPISGTRTDADSITVSGVARPGRPLITGLRVNGVPAFAVAVFDNWSVTVPLSVGKNELVVEVEDENGDVFPLAAVAEVERVAVVPREPARMELDTKRGVVLFADISSGAVCAMDPDTGSVVTVSGDDRGTGPLFERPVDVAYDSLFDRYFVLDPGAAIVVEVDPLTGDRSSIGTSESFLANGAGLAFHRGSGDLWVLTFDSLHVMDPDSGATAPISLESNAGQGPSFALPQDLVVDGNADRIYVLGNERLLEVDSLFGTRKTISDASTGSGMPYPTGASLDRDPVTGEFLVLTDDGDVIRVDPANGDRSPVASAAQTGLTTPFGLLLEPGGERALVTDVQGSAIVAVDVATGASEPLLSNARGRGPRLSSITELAARASDVLALERTRSLMGVISIDPATGNRTLLSGVGVGSGPDFDFPIDLAADPEGGHAWVTDLLLDAVVEVDLVTGARSLFLEGVEPGEIGPRSPLHLAFVPSDPDAERTEDLLVTLDSNSIDIYLSLVGEGDTTLLSSSANAGPSLGSVNDLIFDADNGRLLASGTRLGVAQVVAIDIESGDRTLVTQGSDGGVPFLSAQDMAIDTYYNVALVLDTELDQVLSVSLQTGARQVRAGAAKGSGLSVEGLDGLAVQQGTGQAFAFSSEYRALLGLGILAGDRVIVSK